MKHWKQTRRSGTTPGRRTATEERPPPVRDMLIARLLRALRSNPHGIEGPLVIRYMATAFAKMERGWHPDGLEAVPHDELCEWTRTRAAARGDESGVTRSTGVCHLTAVLRERRWRSTGLWRSSRRYPT